MDDASAHCTSAPNHGVAPLRASRAVVQVDPPSVERSTFDPAPTYTADPATQTESPSSGFMDVHVSPPSVVRTRVPWIDGTAPFTVEEIPHPSAGLTKSTVRTNMPAGSPASVHVAPPSSVRRRPPASATAQPCEASTKSSEAMPAGPAYWRLQVTPPSVVAMIVPPPAAHPCWASTNATAGRVSIWPIGSGEPSGFGPGVVRSACTAIANPAAAIANDAAATATRRQGRSGPRGTGLGRAGAFALASAASHIDGASNRSTSLKRSLRSSIAGSQLLAQPLAGPEQVDADRGSGGADDRGHLAERVPAVVVQDDRGSLVGREVMKGADQIEQLGRLFMRMDARRFGRRSVLSGQAVGDPERRLPDPADRVADRVGAPEGLGERFGDGVGRSFSVSGVQDQGSPEAISLGPVDLLQTLVPRRPHARIFGHHL